MKTVQLIVTERDTGQRIDVAASSLSGFTRSQIHRFIEKGVLTVNNQTTKPNYRARTGDIIHLTIPEETRSLVPEDLPVNILYSDSSLVVADKPPDMVVYPAAGNWTGTLMNAIAFRCGKLAAVGGPLRPGVVHRLDKDTSGVMVIALDDSAYYHLAEQFKERTITRKYKALVHGVMKNDKGEIALQIGRAQSDRKKMSTSSRKGKDAVTTWKVLERFHAATFVEAVLRTGRTHQIRVHFATVGHPVLGDRVYGRRTFLESRRQKIFFPRQMLHADQLGFVHPATGQYMEFSSKLPDDIQNAILAIRGLHED